MSFVIIKTDGKTGDVVSVEPVLSNTTPIQAFDAACKDWQHVRVTLWDNSTRVNLGSRFARD